MLVYVDSERFDVDWQLFTSTVESIVNDMRHATNTDFFTTELFIQSEEDVVLAITVDTTVVRYAIIGSESDDFVCHLPVFPCSDQLFPDCLGGLVRDRQLH